MAARHLASTYLRLITVANSALCFFVLLSRSTLPSHALSPPPSPSLLSRRQIAPHQRLRESSLLECTTRIVTNLALHQSQRRGRAATRILSRDCTLLWQSNPSIHRIHQLTNEFYLNGEASSSGLGVRRHTGRLTADRPWSKHTMRHAQKRPPPTIT